MQRRFLTELSGKPIGPVLEDQADGTDALSENDLKFRSRNIPEELVSVAARSKA